METVGSEECLFFALDYLVTWDANITAGTSYKICATLIGRIVKETIDAV